MALGIPVVASPVGMNRELIRDGVNGFLAADGSAWFSALDALLADAGLARRIGAAGRTTVERDYSLSREGPRVAGLVRDVLR
jgi:glycosyltransferase involved in cell wall biosynthesis